MSSSDQMSDFYGEGTSSGVTASQSRRQTLDRLDDTLVETILSYLTFSEKILFESVSKRFQRLVFNRQTELRLTRWEADGPDYLNQILEPIEVVDFTTGYAHFNNMKQINKKLLESVLKKCKSIDTVVLDAYADRQDMTIIGHNCLNLKTLHFEPIGLNIEDLDHIGRLFGHRLTEIYFYSNFHAKHWTQFLKHCTNLTKIASNSGSDDLIGENDYLPKLEHISDYQIYDDFGGQSDRSTKPLNRFRNLCEKYSKTVKHISISSYISMNKTELNHFLESLSRFRSLKHLNVFFQTEEQTDGTLNQHLTELSANSPDIEYVMLSLYSQNLIFDDILESFKELHKLREFYLYINYMNISEAKELKGSVKSLSSAQNLKRLTISFNNINETFFDGISQHLPNLSSLTIEGENDITDHTIRQLSGLKKLTKFYLNKYKNCNKNITDDSICEIINGCPQIRILSFGSRPNITSKTIEALISCANKYPKREIEFDCGLSEVEDETELLAIDMTEFMDRMPENLRIDITDPTPNDDQ